MASIKQVLRDKKLRGQLKDLGQLVVDELKARGYKLKADDMRDILGKVGTQGKDIGARLSEVLKLEELKAV